MSSHYANLEWAVNERRMDLPRLRAETETALQHAHDDAAARRILIRFLDSFGDGHLEVDWPKAEPQGTATNHAERCEQLGYRVMGKAVVDFSLLPQFSALESENGKFFPGGLLRLSGGRTLGTIRIGVLTEKAYPEACRQALAQLKIAESGDCDEDCSNKIELETANLLTASLTARAEELRRAGATALLIDITHNGGGSDWVEPAVRALSSKPLHAPRLSFVKGEHWSKQLEDMLKEVETDLHNQREPAPALRDAPVTLGQAIAASQQVCNAEEVWTTGKLPCSMLAKNFLFASGVLSYAPPRSLDGLGSSTALFHPNRYSYTENGERLPLYVLVDDETWSAAEYFGAVLQDNQAGIIIGELTGGAGCGFTNGGIPVELKNSKATVKMSDCVRLRADGSDEVNGITPDVLVPWADRDSPYQRVHKLLRVLQSLR